MFELHHLTAQEQLDWLRRGEITPTELVTHYLTRIEAHSDLGAFTTVTPDSALERALAVESLSKASARCRAASGVTVTKAPSSARRSMRAR